MSPEDQPYGPHDPAARPQRRPDQFNGTYGQPSQQYNSYQQNPNQQNPQYNPNQRYGGNQNNQFGNQQFGNTQFGNNQQPDRGDGGPPAGPPRSTLIAIFVGLAIVALLVGVGAAHVFGKKSSPDQTSLQPAVSSTTPSGQQQPVAASTDPDPADTSAPAASPTATQPPNYTAIPADASSEKNKDLDFGFLTKVTSKDGVVSLRFDRAYFYTGAEAIKHNKGVAPNDDYVIENSNPTLRSFDLDPKASLIGVNRLLTNPNSNNRQPLTVLQFVQNSQAALAASTVGVPVWLRHTNGLTGPVTALAEQYLP